ncbi:MAG TPA: DUF4293 domain-containing protein [Prolixibacteraceae bacterium]|jgi:hypothetical protein
MIQRIQTVYLLIAEMLIGVLFFVPFAEIAGKEGSIYRFDMKGIYLEGVPKPEIIYSSLPVVILWAVSLILILATIFLFKNRILQMRISTINIFIQLGLCGLIFYYVWSTAKILLGVYSLRIYLIFPVIAAILIYMAIRAINKDELLVRSIDRIR